MSDPPATRVENIRTRCCIVGGGPAGMMLGYLMARAGVDTVVLEKHADFLRDFRGDTVHPSTLQIMHELGLLETFLRLPHTEVREVRAEVGDSVIEIADFTQLPTVARFLAFMPQWDFLNFLAEQGRRFPNLKVLMQAEATGLIEENGRIEGVSARTPQGILQVRARLTVGCDGRRSVVRKHAGLMVEHLGSPIDVLWFRLPKKDSDPDNLLGHLKQGVMLVTLDRGAYWQCAFVIGKGGLEARKERGLPAFRQEVVRAAGFLADRVDGITDWDDVKLLNVEVDRLLRWSRPGLLCIGDAAHAMSPVGGVGINLAIQDAVATANALAEKLRAGTVTDTDLDAVRRRRLFPTRVIQAIQVFIHRRVLTPTVDAHAPPPKPPELLLQLSKAPWLRRRAGRILGLGVRPEHVQSPAVGR